MYDKYGFVVNKEISTGNPSCHDSSFFMFIQALNYCLKKEYQKAHELYLKCAKIDFYRHPWYYCENDPDFIRRDTSFDMILGWDYLFFKYPEVGWVRPPQHRRDSDYWDGRQANRDVFYLPLAIKTDINLRMKVSCPLGDAFYKNHLLMLKAAISHLKYKDSSVLEYMRKFNKFLEGKTSMDSVTLEGKPLMSEGYLMKEGSEKKSNKPYIIPNLFFDWLCNNPITEERKSIWKRYWYPTGEKQSCEWEYQRDPSWKQYYDKAFADLEFHTEDNKSLGIQFMENV